MNVDLSVLHLVTNASLLVQAVMFVLVGASVASWTLIFRKGREMRLARLEADRFEERFWAGGDLAELHREARDRGAGLAGAERIFDAGFENYLRLLQKPDVTRSELVEGARRSMQVALNREADRLELHLPFLATVGSISPYIGLFGTVWGIMNSFRALASAGQATLTMVAPGIAEALVATAAGLFAAIPAVIAYNRYINDSEKLINRYDNFLEEFGALLLRQTPDDAAARRQQSKGA